VAGGEGVDHKLGKCRKLFIKEENMPILNFSLHRREIIWERTGESQRTSVYFRAVFEDDGSRLYIANDGQLLDSGHFSFVASIKASQDQICSAEKKSLLLVPNQQQEESKADFIYLSSLDPAVVEIHLDVSQEAFTALLQSPSANTEFKLQLTTSCFGSSINYRGDDLVWTADVQSVVFPEDVSFCIRDKAPTN
jgi:hypothetical protein